MLSTEDELLTFVGFEEAPPLFSWFLHLFGTLTEKDVCSF